MIPLTTFTLLRVMPRAAPVVTAFIGPLNQAIVKWNIVTLRSLASFLAQSAHESAQLTALRENLNYSADGLRRVFPKYFPSTELATEYARQPERIANRVYANRLGNGDEASGDGWLYRGGGIFQTTGKSNFRETSINVCGDADTLLSNPELITSPEYACESAGYFWVSRGLPAIIEAGDFDQAFKEVTRRINGGYNGLEERVKLRDTAVAVLTNSLEGTQ